MFAGAPFLSDPIHLPGAPATIVAGLWECDLASEALRWSDGVYRLFGLPFGTPLDRRRIVDCYDRGSRIALECLRTAAIRDRSGFSLDARVVALDGQVRWIRIVARVEAESGKALRLFGAKHDVTAEYGFRGTRTAPPAHLF